MTYSMDMPCGHNLKVGAGSREEAMDMMVDKIKEHRMNVHPEMEEMSEEEMRKTVMEDMKEEEEEEM